MTHTRTQQLKRAFYAHAISDKTSLFQCYDDPSNAKHIAFDYCLRLEEKYNGYYGKIISYNTFGFSFGFIGEINNRPAFFYITKDYDRYIYLDEIQ